MVKDERRTAEALRLTTSLAEVVCCKLMMYLRKMGQQSNLLNETEQLTSIGSGRNAKPGNIDKCF